MKGRSLHLLAILLTLFASASAWAKKVSVEWKPIPGAKGYEIRFEKNGTEVLQAKLSDNEWSGKFSFGVYAYQIRAIDKRGRPGAWSEFTPLVVMANSPKPQSPSDGEKFESYRSAQNVELKWDPVEGAHGYRVDVEMADGPKQTHVVEGTSLPLKLLGAGKYTWTVTALFSPSKERALASLKGKKKWESAPSSKYDFKILQQPLEAPESLLPQGRVDPPANGKLMFEWAAVEGAEAYEVTLEEPFARTFKTKQRRVVIPQINAKDGAKKFKWGVRALASVDSAPLPVVEGPRSVTEVDLDPFAEFVDGSGYVALSGLRSTSSYTATVAGSNRGLRSNSGGVDTIRLSGEYWLRPKLGVGAGFDGSTYNFETSSGSTKAFRREVEIYAKYRVNVPSFLGEWFFSPKAGVIFRDYLLFTVPVGSNLPTYDPLRTFGPSVGFDLRKQLSKRLSLGFKANYYLPLASSDGTLPMSGENLTNVSVGLQGLYWATTHFGVGFGALVESRKLKIGRNSSTAGVDTITTSPFNLFGSLIYSFGR